MYDTKKFSWLDKSTIAYSGFNQAEPVRASFYTRSDGGISAGGATISYAPQQGAAETEYTRRGGHEGFAQAAFAFATDHPFKA